MKVSTFDLLNVAVAASRDGLSSLFNLYLINGLGLGAVEIGWMFSAATAASLLGQIPLGFTYDRVRQKGVVVALGAFGMGLAALGIGLGRGRSFWFVLGAQILYGLATATVSAGMPALTIALTQDRNLGDRLLRNELFAKVGNLSALAFGAMLARLVSLRAIFVLIPILVAPVIWLSLRAPKVDLPKKERGQRSDRLSPLFFCFGVITFLIYLSSTAALPMFEQLFAPGRADGGSGWIAMVTAVTMLTVTLTIFCLSRVNAPRDLWLVLGVAFVVMILRFAVFSIGNTVLVLIAAQILDGCIEGIVYTVPMRLLAYHFRGDFAVLSGVLGATASLGAFASTAISGSLMNRFGFTNAMYVYGAPALIGLLITLTIRARVVTSGRSAGAPKLSRASTPPRRSRG